MISAEGTGNLAFILAWQGKAWAPMAQLGD
jgi:hypothetical protein